MPPFLPQARIAINNPHLSLPGLQGLGDAVAQVGTNRTRSRDLAAVADILKQGGSIADGYTRLTQSSDETLVLIGLKSRAALEAQAANKNQPTSLQRNLEAAGLKPGTPAFRDAILKGTRGGTTVNISNRGQSAFLKELGTAGGKAFFEQRTKAQDAIGIIRTNQEARRLLDDGMITGFGADILTTFGEGLQRIGVNKFNDKIANTRAFVAALGSNVGRVIKQFGAGTGLSDADRAYAEQMAGGKIKLTEGAIRRILDINDRASRFVIQNFNKQATQVQDRFPDAIGIPLTVDADAGFVNQASPPARNSGRITIDINGNPVQ